MVEPPQDWSPADLAQSWPADRWRDERVVLAVSGGADSMALLAAMAEVAGEAGANGSLVVAHCNHALRGADSDADEALVRSTAEQLRLPCVVGSRPLNPSTGVEEQARALRYEFLIATALEHGARYVATAHTADDQAETVLHHILRGTGLAGLAGMSRVRVLHPAVTLVRPLLEFRRAAIHGFVASRDIPFRVDASNADPRFTRNRIRHELLPLLLEQYNAETVPALVRLARLAGDAQEALQSEAARLLELAGRQVGSGWTLEMPPLAGVHRHLVREMLVAAWRAADWPLQAMGFAEWESLAALVLGERGAGPAASLNLPGGIRAARRGQTVVLQPVAE